MSRYANKTSVSVARSRAEIEDTVIRYGASKFVSGLDTDLGEALVGFQVKSVQVRLLLSLPKLADFVTTDAGRRRSGGKPAIAKAHEQGCRSAWRAFLLVIRAKFEAVESGITTFEESFLAHIVVPGGLTVGETIIPSLGEYSAEQLPKLLPGPTP